MLCSALFNPIEQANHFILTYPSDHAQSFSHGHFQLSDLQGKFSFTCYTYCFKSENSAKLEVILPGFYKNILSNQNASDLQVLMKPIGDVQSNKNPFKFGSNN